MFLIVIQRGRFGWSRHNRYDMQQSTIRTVRLLYFIAPSMGGFIVVSAIYSGVYERLKLYNSPIINFQPSYFNPTTNFTRIQNIPSTLTSRIKKNERLTFKDYKKMPRPNFSPTAPPHPLINYLINARQKRLIERDANEKEAASYLRDLTTNSRIVSVRRKDGKKAGQRVVKERGRARR